MSNHYQLLCRKLNELTRWGQLIEHNLVILEFHSQADKCHIIEQCPETEIWDITDVILRPYKGEKAGVAYVSRKLFLEPLSEDEAESQSTFRLRIASSGSEAPKT